MTSFRVNTQSSIRKIDRLQPLLSRLHSYYQEFYRSDRILVDHLAMRAIPEILTDYPDLKSWSPSHRITQLTSVIRSRCFDQQVIAFLERFPEAVVVNVGSRLCTRYWRLPMEHSDWYEVDDADVMALRQQYFTIVPREQDISCDCMDFNWMTQVHRKPNQPILILLEGLCMYLTPQENQALFEAIAQYFGDAHVLFDVVSPRFVTESNLADANAQALNPPEDFLGEWQTTFQWGLASTNALKHWKIQPELIHEIPYLVNIASYPDRLEQWMKNFWPILEPFLKESGKIYQMCLRPS